MRPPPDRLVPGLALALAAGVFAHACGRRVAPQQHPAGQPADATAPPVSASAAAPEPGGNVEFLVQDEHGRPIPCKLTWLGRDGTPTPDLALGLPARIIDGGVAANHRIFSMHGRGSFAVPPGSYELFVSRGPEWSLHVEQITVGAKATKLAATLTHLIARAGWISADTHVHADPSWDSKVPLSARVHEFVSEGVDVLVATDHNVVTDYRPEIERAGAKELLGTVAGAEISTTDWGHFGAFPLRQQNEWWVLHRVRMKGAKPDELLRDVRRHGPTALITVNHPRLGKMGYFSIAGFDPRTALFGRSRVSFEFDAIEVMNGSKHGSFEAVDRVMTDWFGLLQNGRRVTAVGNSDTHGIALSHAGYPRNYVRMDEVGPAVDGERLAAAMREGSSFFSSGPFIEASIDDKSFGQLARAVEGKVTLAVRVRAAPWISVARLRIYANGRPVTDLPIAPSEAVERYSEKLELEMLDDAFVVVRVDGDRELPPVVGGVSGGKLFPIAVSNPIFVDGDGDGRWTARRGGAAAAPKLGR
jgi:hypothetical protein